MKNILKSLRDLVIMAVVVCMMVGMATVSLADWTEDDCYKWKQLPDLAGFDIWASMVGEPPIEVADDFQCMESGPITDIHIWGSHLEDEDAPEDFVLSIYADIPDPDPQNPEDWSMPGALLWQYYFPVGSYVKNLYAYDVEELFYNPATGLLVPDTVVWQYNFYIDPAEAFYQEAGTIYWLGVIEVGGDCIFGWKTSVTQWNDDAVWTPNPGGGGPWIELRHPENHEVSLDMAFVITTETGTIILEKQTDPDGEPQYFDIVDSNTGAVITSLQDGDTYTLNCMQTGTYQIEESVPICWWDLTSVDIDDPNGNSSYDPGTGIVTLNLEAGETIHVTFWDTKRGTIIVEKQTDPDGAPVMFTFEGDAAGTIGDDDQIIRTCLVPYQTYTSKELEKYLWELVDIELEGDTPGGTPSHYNFSEREVYFELDPGEEIKATFTNRYVPPPEEPPAEDHGAPVGIEVFSVNKPALLAPWIALAVVIIAGGIILVRRYRSHR